MPLGNSGPPWRNCILAVMVAAGIRILPSRAQTWLRAGQPPVAAVACHLGKIISGLAIDRAKRRPFPSVSPASLYVLFFPAR